MNAIIDILVVEDSRVQALEIQHILENADYRVTVAHNGRQALELLETQRPTLILSDVVMPEMDGYALCRAVKQDEKLRDIPVILLTSLSDPQDVIRGLESGANNFITKPYEKRFLLSRIQYMLANFELRGHSHAEMGIELLFGGRKHFITSDRFQILDLLISTYETAVQKSRELDQTRINYHTLLENNADAIVVVDQQGIVLFVNPAVDTLFDCVGRGFVGRPFQFPVTPEEMIEITIPQQDGTMAVAEMRVVETFWEGELAYLASLRDITERKQMEEQLRALATTDSLTNTMNRRHFMAMGESEFLRSQRYERPLSAIMLDLDHFKEVNDQYGHAAGDQVLQVLAEICRTSLRRQDMLGRYGGEEFVILLPETPLERAMHAADRLREQIEQLSVPTPLGEVRVAASLGVAGMDHSDPEEKLERLLNRADEALYAAKRAGRNRVMAWQPLPTP